MEDYEKLGKFYLGRGYDLEKGELRDELTLYDSKDLVTHGVTIDCILNRVSRHD